MQIIRYHLGDKKAHTVYEAEAVGLTLAAKMLLAMPRIKKEVDIMIDNQAAIQSGERPTTKPGHYILHHLHRLIKDVKRKHDLDRNQITVRWIPGHAGVPGNEKADEAAREAASSKDNNSEIHSLPKYLQKYPLLDSITALKQAHRELSKQRWAANWSKLIRFQRMNRFDMDKPSNSFLKLISPLSKILAGLTTNRPTHRTYCIKWASPLYQKNGIADVPALP
jgi:ribonuclease HI